jgi:hypothetical protein
MTNVNIRSTLFDNEWKGECKLTLCSGEVVPVPHRDFVFVPPDDDFAIVVKVPQRTGFRVLGLDQIASVEFTKAAK